jgi:hypothetical protein
MANFMLHTFYHDKENPVVSSTYHGIHEREGSLIQEGPSCFAPHGLVHMVQFVDNVVA